MTRRLIRCPPLTVPAMTIARTVSARRRDSSMMRGQDYLQVRLSTIFMHYAIAYWP